MLLASLQLDVLATCVNEGEVWTSRQDIPSDLEDFYSETMKRIDAQPANRKNLAYRTLI
jgi:hypothetical protein